MCLWRNKSLAGLLLLAAVLVAGGCAFADLGPIGISTIPSFPYEILREPYSPVVLCFDTGMDRGSVEKLFQVNNDEGVVQGDISWQGSSLVFVPAASWTPGTRYILRLLGTVTAEDGRELALSKTVPFFAQHTQAAPYLQSFSPREGAAIAALAPGEEILALQFSCPMEKKSAESALTIDAPGTISALWDEEGKEMRLISDKALEPWKSYRWSVTKKALSAEGAALAKEYSGTFVTGEDREFPRVVSILPLLKVSDDGPGTGLWGNWSPAAQNLSGGLGQGLGIGVEFSKPMNDTDIRNCVSLSPALSGWTVKLSPRSIVYVPERDPEPETGYALTIAGSVRDSTGLKMGSDYKEYFSSDIPWLKLISISVDGSGTFYPGDDPVSIDAAVYNPGGVIRFTLNFSVPLSREALEEAVFKVTLKSHFPGTLGPGALRFISAPSVDKLRMEWEGLTPGTAAEPHYYKLSVPGGKNGVRSGSGSYLKTDEIIYFKAVQP